MPQTPFVNCLCTGYVLQANEARRGPIERLVEVIKLIYSPSFPSN